MSLPRITNPTPITSPAVPEKTFPDIFVREMIITCSPNDTWRASIMVQPYNYDLNEVNEAVNPNYINIEDLKAEAAQDEEVGFVMATLLSIVEKRLNPPAPAEPEPTTP